MDTITKDESTLEQAKDLGLLPEEFEMIKKVLGRTPNFTELSIFSIMWSEHCSYKNSILWLKTLPKKGPHLLVEAGEENAGLVDIGDGLGCAFKIESHNHPSAIEPYQGAATGVGGINRDIFTMGARPIAQLNSLRFGSIENERTKWLLKGVVKGIGDYGNAFGIPVLGGEVFFDPSYETNPLVNAMSVGILKTGEMISATSYGVGNPVYIVGSATGKDGINGASFASKDITADSAEDLPSVQVGDPFQEKLLLEATLELAKTDAVVGMQDMGAAGITCSTSEMSATKGFGMRIDLDKVPTRQEGMLPFEILLSESQERMLVVAHKGKESVVEEIFEKWDLNAVQIGEVTEGGRLHYYMHGELVADVPAHDLVLGGGAPVYDREYKEPAYFKENQKFRIDTVEEPTNMAGIASRMIGLPNIASKRWVYEQYDSMVGTRNMSTNAPSDAGVVNIKNVKSALAMTVDCNARYVHNDPKKGTAIAVAEAARNITCTGGEPSAITNCLNFGNPYNPEVYWQFVMAIKGMSEACTMFKTPVTGGNVSFYNQTSGGKNETIPVFPTPTIGMIGIIKDKSKMMTLDFKEKGDLIFLIGESEDDINSSEYLSAIHGITASPAPHFDIDREYAVQDAVRKLIQNEIINAAHDVSDGGLYTTLVEMGLNRGLGFDITTDAAVRMDAFLFGESQSRIVVTIDRDSEESLIESLQGAGVPFTLLGHVTRGKMVVDDEHYSFIADAAKIYNEAIERKLETAV
ncbi:MAG TPA: phosphoribosylformylglycinamidine synthase subunit PurL [Cryomorphaceae bacterium]|nr:phosphoribosylformylglycinamidine synthase subunit PurL [Cryomorphaceae bacterium]